MGISQGDLPSRVRAAESFRRNGDNKGATEEERVAARKAYQDAQGLAARETGERQLLRELYAEQQLLEQLSWFWFNHFNVHQGKRDIRLMLADYQDRALRPQALGSFRTMLGAVARHPAMLRYLDNDQNAVRAINENYARELLELHTLGVDGGYTQRDVQELARVLTGFGVRVDPDPAKVAPRFEALYKRDGLFEFHPGDGALRLRQAGGVLPRRTAATGRGRCDGRRLPENEGRPARDAARDAVRTTVRVGGHAAVQGSARLPVVEPARGLRAT